jgi:replication factor C subunit 1
MKASQVFAPKRQTKERPDLEEALEESDDGGDVNEVAEKEEKEENDISKDKYIKAPKKKAPPKATAAKGKKRAGDSDVEDSEPKKPKAAKGKSRAKK